MPDATLAADETVLVDADGVQRMLRRLAHQVVEREGGAQDVVLVGIRSRGVPIARRLAATIEQVEGTPVAAGAVDVTLYRDDLSHRGPLPLGETHVPVPLDGRTVVLVDDVLMTGRTIRAAMEAVFELGRPSAVRLLVLVDRGHRELPIRADHVGKNVPTALGDDVRVRLAETDGHDAITQVRVPTRVDA